MRTDLVRSLWLAGLFALCVIGNAGAQAPDMRNISPFVMIVADTSGSMEYRADCQCAATGGCSECYPKCSEPNTSGIAPPEKKNRWAMLLESLTGSFIDFQCVPKDRSDSAHFTYDINYALPYHRPWACPGGAPFCAYPGTSGSPIQVQNGLLDNYANRLRFGLATFDGMRTYTGAGDLVTTLNPTLSDGEKGMFSYGGPKAVRYPTCTQTHYIDSGIRAPAALEGGLVSLDSNLCVTPPCDTVVVSEEIQRRLLATRPYGGTPTASALDDLYTHFKNLNDPMASCRDRYAILITDGYPDDDFREYPNPGCDCVERNNCPPGDNVGMSCPYPTAADAAKNLVKGRADDTTTDTGQLKKLFVVGMSINDTASRDGLDLIAMQGGSDKAFFADTPATLTSTLDTLFANLTRPISRSVPAFAIGQSGRQYQISTGFTISAEKVAAGTAPLWKGSIERRRFECNSVGAVTVPELKPEDRFDVQLNSRPGMGRWLWTALPPNPTATTVQGTITRIDTDTTCPNPSGCTQQDLSGVAPAVLGDNFVAADKTEVVKWMYGDVGSARENAKLGDIYHSSPTIVGPPVADPGDQSYTLFRDSPLIKNRPTMLYVNSNDGILHAFVLEDHPTVAPTLSGGHELWGFVPPVLLPQLKPQITTHRLNLDATPVVKDVYFKKSSTVSADDYKTVLITGMRSGGSAYIALDVTNPRLPKFMWQFKGAEMGETYGQPLIVQARYEWPEGQQASLRAMAILPGGKGVPDSDFNFPGCDSGTHSRSSFRVPNTARKVFTTLDSANTGANEMMHRAELPCWESQGRALYFVDIETGKLIKKITVDSNNELVFPSPVVGSPTAYQDAVGMTATEGFVVDADGVLWRIDLTASDQEGAKATEGWTVRPFHDLFWDLGPNSGETTYERPILSLDDKHQLVVIVGTGDTDNFEKSGVKNRVVSVTQTTKTPTPTKPSDYIGALNWELRVGGDNGQELVTSELVTGTMALFSQQLFLASFISRPSSDPCDFGLGRLWSLHYTERGNANVTGNAIQTFSPKRIPVSPLTNGTADAQAQADLGLFNVLKDRAEENLLILGLGSTQRISSCETGETADADNYYQTRDSITNIRQGNTPPSIWIVGQASSADTAEGRARQRAGSSFGTMEVQVARPQDFSRVSSWAGSIE